MMGKWIGIGLAMALAAVLASCGQRELVTPPTVRPELVEPAVEAEIVEPQVVEPQVVVQPEAMVVPDLVEPPEIQAEPDSTVDIDVTRLSATMVYAEVYHMLTSPEEYVGKTVKLHGIYSFYEDPETGTQYHAIIVQDATACCAVGLDFLMTEDYAYPEDYPVLYEEATIIGEFETFESGGMLFGRLKDAYIPQA